jgi:hypothetical protein
MIGNNLPQLSGTKQGLLVLLASTALFTAGCSNMLSTAPSSAVVSNAISIGGKVHGGSQPVSGATVKLYAAGQGTNTPPTELATTYTDALGKFSFINSGTTGGSENGNIYSCPSPTVSNPLVYVVSRGGNTIGDGNTSESNSGAVFIGIYGDCSKLSASQYITLNEVTTVATMIAVQQYYDPASEKLTADATGAAKIAFDATPATIANLANVVTGTANSSTSIPGVKPLTVTVTATPETSKINLLANILTSCVNNASVSANNCTTLFSSAVPPAYASTTNFSGETFAPATDVLQAIDYMLINPTSGGATNRANLFALAGGNAAAFVPALAVQPSDWTVAISYSSASNCANGGALLSAPNALSIDLDGNVWVGNGQTTNGNVVELSSSGVPIICNSFGSGATAAPGALVIDSEGQNGGNGRIWSALSGSSTITRYNPDSATSLAFTAPGPVLAITGDGPGNIYFSVAGGLYVIPVAAATASTASTPVLVSSTVANATSLMPDFKNGISVAGNVWASSGTSTLQQIVPSTTAPVTYTVNPFTATADTQGIVVTDFNNVFVSSVTPGNSIGYFYSASSSYQLLDSLTAPLGGINQPAAITVDGASNVWSANLTPNTNPAFASDPTASPTQFSVSEISIGGSPLSPTTASGGFQKSASYLDGASSIIVDQSGNVWIAGGAAGSNFITEIVGAGVPTYQPFALGLHNGRFQNKP